jgi:hypothetical protein
MIDMIKKYVKIEVIRADISLILEFLNKNLYNYIFKIKLMGLKDQ